MTKRAPDDPRGYSNRAAALIKLMTFPGAVSDCDIAIQKDPKFIRAYLRKAQAYFAMKEYSKCTNVCAEAMQHDEGGKNYGELEQQQQKAMNAQFSARVGETEEQTQERIQKDPEVSRNYVFLSWSLVINVIYRLWAYCKTQSCKVYCSKRRPTLPPSKTTCRMPISGTRSRNWLPLV